MKDIAIGHSIGAALRACAEQAQAGQMHAGQVQAIQPAVRTAPDRIARDRLLDAPVHLTQRQLEVLALLCEGLQNKVICRRLEIATGTVKVHISCILRELGVRTRLEAVIAAHRLGLVGKPVRPEPIGSAADDGSAPVPRIASYGVARVAPAPA
jgi:DNA-binding NarL/FixJ family response regulator